MVVLCGDEVSSVVIDVGTQVSKFGYTGDDAPKAIFSSMVGYIDEAPPRPVVGDINLSYPRNNMEMKSPLVDGELTDWEVISKIWHYGLRQCLTMEVGTPILCAVPSWARGDQYKRILEMGFETFETNAMYIARDAVLSAFSKGRPTAVVCDCGAGTTSAVPVVDGYVLKKSIIKSSRGGDFLDQKMLEALESEKFKVVPRYEVAKRNVAGPVGRPVHPSYRKYYQMQVVRDVKESCCTVPRPPSDDSDSMDTESESEASQAPPNQYELPDGTKLTVEDTSNIAKIPEFLIVPSPASGSSPAFDGLPKMVYQSAENSDVDVRKELLGNIVLTGGGSLFSGLAERIRHEVAGMLPSSYRAKVVLATPLERRFSVWIGGSILATLGSFQQLWLTKQEYAELGPDRALERFDG